MPKAEEPVTSDDVTTMMHLEEPEPTYAVLLEWSKRYPQFRDDLAEFCSIWAYTDLLLRILPEPEPGPQEDEFDRDMHFSWQCAMQRIDHREAGISDDKIISLNDFEEMVLEAVQHLHRRGCLENIVAGVSELSGRPESPEAVLETLKSLESRNAVYSLSLDSEQFPDEAGIQYFVVSPIGAGSLEKALAAPVNQ